MSVLSHAQPSLALGDATQRWVWGQASLYPPCNVP